MDGQPGDKSPGYYRASLRDEVKTGLPSSTRAEASSPFEPAIDVEGKQFSHTQSER
jgi:hypothetical protein